MAKRDIYEHDNEFVSIRDFLNPQQDQYKFEHEYNEDNGYDENNEYEELNEHDQSLEEKIKSTGHYSDTISNTNNTNNKIDSGFLGEILTDKIRFLKQILDEIDDQIKDRDYLKDKIIDKIDNRICFLQTELYDCDNWELGKNRNIDTRRAQIEKELEALQSQIRNEKRESWRDAALLKKEQRQFYHEYRNALRRVKIIFPDKVPNKSK